MSYGRTKIKNLESVDAENKSKFSRIEAKSKGLAHFRPSIPDIVMARSTVVEETKVVLVVRLTIMQDQLTGRYSGYLTDFPSVVAQGETLGELGESLNEAHAAVLGYQSDRQDLSVLQNNDEKYQS